MEVTERSTRKLKSIHKLCEEVRSGFLSGPQATGLRASLGFDVPFDGRFH
jgi:hypothetical protein